MVGANAHDAPVCTKSVRGAKGCTRWSIVAGEIAQRRSPFDEVLPPFSTTQTSDNSGLDWFAETVSGDRK